MSNDKMREALNLLCIDGELNTTFDLMQESNSPDAKFNLLSAFAAVAISKYAALEHKPTVTPFGTEPIAFEPEVSQPVANTLLTQFIDSVEGNCYMGKEWELKTCQELRNTSPPDYEALKAESTHLQAQLDEFATLEADYERTAIEELAKLEAENEALKAEITRLQYEVINRNRRALDGDLAVQVRDTVIAENESLKLRVTELEAASDFDFKEYKRLRDSYSDECDKLNARLDNVLLFTVSDTIAMTYQSNGQYRNELINLIKEQAK